MTRLYLVRHGETEWNKASKVQGRTDTELSEKGIRQAELLSERIAGEDIAAIYSSSLNRALRTAEIIAGRKDCRVEKSESYHEIRLGPWEGLTIHEIQEKYSEYYKAYREDPEKFSLPGAETFLELIERTYGAIIKLVEKHKGSSILIVSHGTAIKAAMIRILGIGLINYTKFRIDNASVSIIEFPDDTPQKPVVLCLNDTSHLRGNI